jgi:eukaryotic-like serine/threonine-protein kinase
VSTEAIAGRYVVEGSLGRGGMASVHLARDEQLGRFVAVKRLSESLGGDEVFRERFLREARLAAGLSHPNIVAVFDVGEEDGVPYIVMEYVPGQTLADLMESTGPMDSDRAVDLVLQACAGLEHAHSAGLVHRDIKPQNLLVRDDDTLKIVDFGIARPVDGTQLTLAGTILGTAAYLSPEQALGERVTAAADIYSLGAVTYELLTGRHPYEFESLADLPVKQREGPPPRIAGVSADVEQAVLACLAANPEARPPSAVAYARELSHASSAPPIHAVPTESPTVETAVLPPRRTIHNSRLAQITAAVALGVLALLGGLWFGLSRGDDSAPRPPPAEPIRQDVVPRGATPEESARLLAEWLRARAG